MIDDQIRKYVRAQIDENDTVVAYITRIANGAKEAIIQPISVVPLNISSRGMKFLSNLTFSRGIIMDLSVKIEDKNITATAKVVRMEPDANGYVSYGVLFTQISDFHQIIISNFVKRKTIDYIHQLRNQ